MSWRDRGQVESVWGKSLAHHDELDELLASWTATVTADEAFHRLADERWREVEAGATVEWDEARAWVEARLRGEARARPRR